MNPNDEVVSQNLAEIERRRQLADQQANPDVWDRNHLPATWDSKDKYGQGVIAVRDEDRDEIEGAIGIVDRAELLICEEKVQSEAVAHNSVINGRNEFVRPLLAERGWSINDWATKAGVDFHTADNYLKGSNTYESSRKKLSDALHVAKLPV